jgi:membrane fusion protein (multidrug efflux system)
MYKSVIGSLFIVLIVLAVGGGLAYWKHASLARQAVAAAPPEMPETVVIRRVLPVSYRQSVTSIGTVLAPRSVELRTEAMGTIQSLTLQAGAIVEPAEVLLQLDASVEQAQLQGALASLKIAESTYRRTRQAADAKALSELELEQAEAMLAQSRAEIARWEAVIRKKTLTAPFRARVGLFDLHVGQYLPEGARITMLQGVEDFIHVDFAMPQQVADKVRVGDEARLFLEGEDKSARIIAIDSQADRWTRSLSARARLESPPADLQPNDSVKIRLEYGEPIQAVAVPGTALRRTPEGSIVFVAEVEASGKLRARRTPVVAGIAYGEQIIIHQGLVAGQQIVTDGSFKLRENSLLMPSETVDTETAVPDPVSPPLP